MGGRQPKTDPTPKVSGPAITALRRRLQAHRAALRRLGFDPDIYKKLLPFVRWTSGEAVVEPHPAVTERLERTLGPRLPPLKEPITQPPLPVLRAEIRRQLQKGVPPDVAPAMADMTLMQGAMRAQGRDPALERETPGWEAATAAAVADAALRNGLPKALQNADEYFERLDTARAHGAVLKEQIEEEARRRSAQSVPGGRARAAGKPVLTAARNKAMIQDFIVAVTQDGMTSAEAVKYVAQKNRLTRRQARTIIKPRSRMKDVRRSIATAPISPTTRSRRR